MKPFNKKTSPDFKPAMLPQNRREVFFDILRIHWTKLLGIGFVVILFLLPLFLLLWIGDGQKLSLLEISGSLSDAQLREAQYSLATASNIRGIVGILAWGWFGVGLAGIIRVIRQYAWEENVRFFADFAKGVRDNLKHTVILCLIIGFISAICSGTYNMSPYGADCLQWLSLIQIGVFVVLLPVFALWLSMIPVYSNSVFKYAMFSFAVYLKSVFKTFPVLLCCMLIVLPVLLPMPSLHIVGLFIISFLLPYILLIWTLYSYSLFDQYINPRFYPELFGKGILGLSVKAHDITK